MRDNEVTRILGCVDAMNRNRCSLKFVNIRRFASVHNTALSTDRDCDWAENVNVVSSTVVRSYRAGTLFRAFMYASRITGTAAIVCCIPWRR